MLGCYFLLGLIKEGQKAELLYFADDEPMQASKYITQGGKGELLSQGGREELAYTVH